MTSDEAQALREVAAIMRACAAELPKESPIRRELGTGATRLFLQVDRQPQLQPLPLPPDGAA